MLLPFIFNKKKAVIMSFYNQESFSDTHRKIHWRLNYEVYVCVRPLTQGAVSSKLSKNLAAACYFWFLIIVTCDLLTSRKQFKLSLQGTQQVSDS